MAYYTYAAEGRPGFEQLGIVAYHDRCVPEEIRHFKFNPPIVHVDLGSITIPGYWSHAPGWL